MCRRRADILIENLALRHQLAALKKDRPRPPLEDTERAFWVALRKSWPGVYPPPLENWSTYPTATADLNQAQPSTARPPRLLSGSAFEYSGYTGTWQLIN